MENNDPFPYPCNYKTFTSYVNAVEVWKKKEEIKIVKSNCDNEVSAFYRRPYFDPDSVKYTRGYPQEKDQINIFNAVLNNEMKEDLQYWIYDKNLWAITKIRPFPSPYFYSRYNEFEKNSVKWISEQEEYLKNQFPNVNDIISITQVGKKKQIIRASDEDKVEQYNNFHPSRILHKFQFLEKKEIDQNNRISNIYKAMDNINQSNKYVEKNEFYKKCLKMSKNQYSQAESLFDSLVFDFNTFKPKPIQTTKSVLDLVLHGATKPLRPYQPLQYKLLSQDHIITMEEFHYLLDLPLKYLLRSNESCIKIMNFALSPIFMKPILQFVFTNEKLFYHLAMVCWRFNLTGKPPFKPHIKYAKEVPPHIRQFWSYSVRCQLCLSLVRTFGTLQKCKKQLSFVNTQRKTVTSELSTFIKKNKQALINYVPQVKKEGEFIIVVDVIISVLLNETSSAYSFVSNSSALSFDFLCKLIEISPKAFQLLTTNAAFNPCIISHYLQHLAQWESFRISSLTPPMISFINLLSRSLPHIIPSNMFINFDWIVIQISYLMQFVSVSSSYISVDTVEELVKFMIRYFSSQKKKPKQLPNIIQNIMGIISANVAAELNTYCLAKEIEIASHLFIEPSIASDAITLICRVADKHYIVAHSAYKVLKSLALNNKNYFIELFQTKQDVLKAAFMIVQPATMLDLMKFLAVYINKNIEEESKTNIGFLGAPSMITPDMVMILQFFFDCNLQPKHVASVIKQINPRPAEITIRSSSMKLLQLILSKRPTLAKLILFGGNQQKPAP